MEKRLNKPQYVSRNQQLSILLNPDKVGINIKMALI